MITISQAKTEPQLDNVRDLMRAFITWHYERHHEEIDLVDGYFDADAFERELAQLPGEFSPPKGRLLLASNGDEPAGCVALQDFGDGICEMKRMFLYEKYHGQGVGRLLAEAVIEEARKAGYNKMRLDTGARQYEAQGLYRSLGFKPIEPYYDMPEDIRDWLHFMELNLEG